MSTMASQITSISIVYSAICSGAHKRKHQSSALLAFVRAIHRWLVDSPPQRSSNAENVSIWRRHHDLTPFQVWINSCIGGCKSGQGVSNNIRSSQLETLLGKHDQSLALPFKYMVASSNVNIFRFAGPLWGAFTGQTVSNQSRRHWFETPSHSLCTEVEWFVVASTDLRLLKHNSYPFGLIFLSAIFLWGVCGFAITFTSLRDASYYPGKFMGNLTKTDGKCFVCWTKILHQKVA